MWEKIKALFKAKGIEIPADKEKEFETAIEALAKESNGNVDLTKLAEILKSDKTNTNPALDALIQKFQVLEDQNKKLLDALGKEISDREKANTAATEQAKAQAAQKVQDTITAALKNKKITEADKEIWTARLTKDFDEWNKELEAKPVPKEFQQKQTNQQQQQQQPGPVSTGNKTLDAVLQHNQGAAIAQPFNFGDITK